MRSILLAAAAGIAVIGCGHATVTQTTGAGSAVLVPTAHANFESTDALNDNPYVEEGMSFSRTNLSFDNNSCGYAGCSYNFPYFSANYEYGTGTGGYFQIAAPTGKPFTGLEFIAGSGFSTSSPLNFTWEAFLNGNPDGSGSGSVSTGTVLGFSDPVGFDTLLWTESYTAADFSSTYNAPAFDSVSAQFTVPEPVSMAVLGFGLASLGLIRRRKGA